MLRIDFQQRLQLKLLISHYNSSEYSIKMYYQQCNKYQYHVP